MQGMRIDFQDLSGHVFGELTVIEYSHTTLRKSGKRKGRKDSIYFKCQCTCGKEVSIAGTSLKSQHTMSCGCKKMSSEKNRTSYNRNFTKYKYYANKESILFELTKEDAFVLFQSPCHYCGIEACNGIDKIEGAKGYIPMNCVPCCAMCNRMKSVYTQDRFYEQIDRIHKHRQAQQA